MVLLALQVVKVTAVILGVLALYVVLGMMIDLLKDEWKLKRTAWRVNKEALYTSNVIRHRHRARHDKITREKAIWDQLFFGESVSSVNSHARKPARHRYVIRMEPLNV